MIIVTMMLHSAITGKKTQLAAVRICNVGGTDLRGNYSYEIMGKRCGIPLRKGRIENWPRKSKTALALVQRVLNDAYGVPLGYHKAPSAKPSRAENVANKLVDHFRATGQMER